MGRPHTDALGLFANMDSHGRWQLRVNLAGNRREVSQSLVRSLGSARALLKTTHDIRGYTCNLHYIAPGDWYRYEADHDVHGDQCDCRLGAINVSDP